MNATATPLLNIFEKKLRLEVPLFQRQYVWNLEHQWEPLWEDISRKFIEYLEGRKDSPVHFLGAMVLDQKQTPTTHVEKRQVIDGQQRLTTLQIFLSAFRDICKESEVLDLANECDSFILNKGMMTNPEIDKYKVWPTQLDRKQFSDVMNSGSRKVLEQQYPLVKRKYKRSYESRPRMIEAYIFFYEQLFNFFVGNNYESPLAVEKDIATRFDECFQALKNALHVVVIDLDKDDDAQVIFETLNARGEPLLPADLLRNYIFLRAARQGESAEELYNEFWKNFDDEFWRKEIRQGRLNRPRSDIFLQHYLASKQTIDIPIKHLYVEYKFWIEKYKPYSTIREELFDLSKQGIDFKRIINYSENDFFYPLAIFLNRFDISTVYPLILHLFNLNISEEKWKTVSIILESYVLRRAVCGLTAKNYNRLFLSIIRYLKKEGTTVENLWNFLDGLSGESVEWPTDEVFQYSWENIHIYRTFQSIKIIHMLKRLSDTYMSSRSEELIINTPLTIEHLIPNDWYEYWPLPDGSTGLQFVDLFNYPDDDPRVIQTKKREELIQTIGNLTIITQPLNSSISKNNWKIKKPAILTSSLLPINQQLSSIDELNEQEIINRSRELFKRALKIWPRNNIIN
jgi:uncharacterized protein with ParB-like and HNH nuclease domain